VAPEREERRKRSLRRLILGVVFDAPRTTDENGVLAIDPSTVLLFSRILAGFLSDLEKKILRWDNDRSLIRLALTAAVCCPISIRQAEFPAQRYCAMGPPKTTSRFPGPGNERTLSAILGMRDLPCPALNRPADC
jgi:hypothetical protein